MMGTFFGVDPGLRSGGAAIVDHAGYALLLAGWFDGRYYQSIPAGRIWLELPAGHSGARSALSHWTASGVTRSGAAIEQPLTTGVGRHADTWRSVGQWEQSIRERGVDVRLVPYRTWTRAAGIAGSDGVAEVRRRVRELTASLDPMMPSGRGGWPAQARDAAREAYLIACWCALEVGA